MEVGKVRIYVGGLGEKVTMEEVRKMVSVSLGEIQTVEMVKTKGRSFAYVDFLPSSPSSLSKLFSTYNGCVWKGGRLRLEKAKEHYLARLQREWAEDSELANSASSTGAALDADEDVVSLNMPKRDLNPEKDRLKIFFPALRKVKSIPFSGTGKHKYSFRRVEVLSLPKYFCDCEEHSSPPASRGKPSSSLEEQGVGMNGDEINMMNSVMNKLFARENISQTVSGRIKVNDDRDNSAQLIDGLQEEDKAELATDEEDNLIINIKTRGQETGFAEEVSKLKEKSFVKDGPTYNVVAKQRRDHAAPDKKRVVVQEDNGACGSKSSISLGEESSQACSKALGKLFAAPKVEPGSWGKLSSPSSIRSQKSSWKELIDHRGNNAFKISDVLPGSVSSTEEKSKSADGPISGDNKDEKLLSSDNQKDQLPNAVLSEHLSKAQSSKPESGANKSGRGSAWLQKSSWTQLIGGSSSNAFSITQILPGIAFEKQESGELDHMEVANSTCSNKNDILGEGESETIADSIMYNNMNDIIGEGKSEATADGVAVRKVSSGQNTHDNSHELTRPFYEINGTSDMSKAGTEDTTAIGETCLFMRTAASLKEWANAKAALTASRKRKK